MRRKHALIIVIASLAFCPVSAVADVGTPLVWASTFHLFLGNAIIGLIEGSLLARYFHLSKRRCRWLLILANYLSAWIGMLLTRYLFQKYATNIYTGLRVTWLLVAVSYLLTLIVEWPFVALCFRSAPRWFAKSVGGSVLIQSASYAVLFGGYWLVSGKSLYTGMDVVPPGIIAPPRGVIMFFISSSDGDVYRSEMSSAPDIKVSTLGSTNYYDDHLELQESQTDSDRWDITAVVKRGKEARVMVPGVLSTQQIALQQALQTSSYYGWAWAPFQVGNATNSSWHFGWAHWPDVGMWARSGSKTVRIAYGTPFGGWSPYRVIHLPGDKALLQLEDRICLVDIPSRRIAEIRKGYGIVAFQKDHIIEDGAPKVDPSSVTK